jgi:hypothetical protein
MGEVFVNILSLRNQRNRDTTCETGGFAGLALLRAFCAVLGGAALISASSALAGGGIRSAQDKEGAGITFSKQATPKEVGLPAYPGAKLHKDEKNDSASVQMGIWGGEFGFRLAVMKMESNDGPEKLAEFYKKALAKYGTVLNCSDASQKAKDKDGSSNKLTCDDDKPEKGGLVFKAGTKEKQHIVAIQANGPGSLFQLVYLEARGDDKDKKPI